LKGVKVSGTVHDLVRFSASRFDENVAIKDERGAVSFSQLLERASGLAAGLRSLGLGRGDRVAAVMYNRREWIELQLAVSMSGAAFTRLNARDSDTDWSHIISDVDAKVVVADEAFAERVRALQRLSNDSFRTIELGADFEGLFLESDPTSDDLVRPDDVYIIYHTSGTTGQPKGVVYEHRQMSGTFRDATTWAIGDLKVGDTFLHVGPLSHQSGMLVVPCLLKGVRQVIQAHFDVDAIIEAIETERVTATILAPTMLSMLVDRASETGADLSSLQRMFYSGAPMAPARIKKALDTLGPVLTQGYGLMEGGGFYNTILWPEDHVRGLAGDPGVLKSAGRPIPTNVIEIVDDEGHEVPLGVAGQLLIRSERLPRGYWQRQEATDEATRFGGWLTGDVAYRDANGLINIVDRKNDMIVTGGFNVYPREVEDVLLAHPRVSNAAVVSTAHDKWGEAVTAVVTLSTGGLDLEELQEWCRQQGLASYKKPIVLVVRDKIPLTAVGKVNRRAIREEFWKSHERLVN
jgi:acyl-CoA synthetase (AMP-forming)/AMP-acid ligase II